MHADIIRGEGPAENKAKNVSEAKPPHDVVGADRIVQPCWTGPSTPSHHVCREPIIAMLHPISPRIVTLNKRNMQVHLLTSWRFAITMPLHETIPSYMHHALPET